MILFINPTDIITATNVSVVLALRSTLAGIASTAPELVFVAATFTYSTATLTSFTTTDALNTVGGRRDITESLKTQQLSSSLSFSLLQESIRGLQPDPLNRAVGFCMNILSSFPRSSPSTVYWLSDTLALFRSIGASSGNTSSLLSHAATLQKNVADALEVVSPGLYPGVSIYLNASSVGIESLGNSLGVMGSSATSTPSAFWGSYGTTLIIPLLVLTVILLLAFSARSVLRRGVLQTLFVCENFIRCGKGSGSLKIAPAPVNEEARPRPLEIDYETLAKLALNSSVTALSFSPDNEFHELHAAGAPGSVPMSSENPVFLSDTSAGEEAEDTFDSSVTEVLEDFPSQQTEEQIVQLGWGGGAASDALAEIVSRSQALASHRPPPLLSPPMLFKPSSAFRHVATREVSRSLPPSEGRRSNLVRPLGVRKSFQPERVVDVSLTPKPN